MRPGGLGLAALVLLATAAAAADWPQFRGPSRDGRSAETGLLTAWPEDGPEERFRVELGGGYGGIAVADGRLYTQSAESGGEILLALDADSGVALWRYRTDRNRADSQGGGPRATPAVAGELAYAVSAYGKLHAVAVADGALRWSVDLVRELGGNVPEWGYSSSPLVDGEVLYVETGGGTDKAVTAFDRHTGKVIWQAGSDLAGYASPQIVEIAGLRQLLSFGASALTSLGPVSGRVFWSIPWTTRYDVNAAMPVVAPPDLLFVSSGYNVGAAVVRLRLEGTKLNIEQLWHSRVLRNKFASSVADQGMIYGFDEDTLKCVEALTGKARWRISRSHGALIYADGHLLVLDGIGRLFLAAATAEAWTEKAKAAVLKGRTWNAPALANGVFYARTADQLVAMRVGVGERAEP